MGLVAPQTVTLLQTGDLSEGQFKIDSRKGTLLISRSILGAGFDNWLDAVDGSFCTFAGGDDPNQVSVFCEGPYVILNQGSIGWNLSRCRWMSVSPI
jgi:tripeptidyl-peptidase-1